MNEHVLCAVHEGTLTITLARPERRNALTVAMYSALAAVLKASMSDPQIRAIVLTGAGGIFTAGNDLEEFLAKPPPVGADAAGEPVFDFMHALTGCHKPVIAAVVGPAVGIGATLLLHCDLVFLSDDARLSMPFVNLGLVPEFAASVLLPQRVGHARAASMLLLGEPLSARDAIASGLANAVLPADEVLPAAHQAAARFNRLPPGAVRDSKKLLRRPESNSVAEAIRTEARVFAERLRSPEAREAMQAFFEKRPPDFSRF